MRNPGRDWRALILLIACCVQSGCEQLPLREIAPVVATLESAQGAVTVERAGKPVAVVVPMALREGDIVATFSDGSAELRFPGAHQVQLLPETRVRVGSLFVFIGTLFVEAKGFFQVENEFVSLEVESTQFWFRVGSDRSVSAGVWEGSVRMRSRTGRWKSFRLSRDEATIIPRDGQPTIEENPFPPFGPSANQGWCCANGELQRGKRVECERRRGQFYESEAEGRRYCRAPDGWCCADGELSRQSALDCRERGGRFYPSENEGRQQCRAAIGWCCVNASLSQLDRLTCAERRGQFYEDDKIARERCVRGKPPQAEVERFIGAANGLAAILDRVAISLSQAITALNNKRASEAEDRLAEARQHFKNSDAPFRALSQHNEYEPFRKLYRLAQTMRGLQSEALASVQKLTAETRGDRGPSREAAGAYNKLKIEYDGRVNEYNQAIRALY